MQVTFDDKEKIAYMIGNTQLYIIDVSAALLLGGAGVAQLPTLKAVDLGAPVNDVYFCGGYVAVAVNGASKNLPGFVAIYGRFVRGQPFLELTRIGVGKLRLEASCNVQIYPGAMHVVPH